MVARGRREEGMGCYCLMGIYFQFCKMKNSGDSQQCELYLTLLNSTLKMAKMINLYFIKIKNTLVSVGSYNTVTFALYNISYVFLYRAFFTSFLVLLTSIYC